MLWFTSARGILGLICLLGVAGISMTFIAGVFKEGWISCAALVAAFLLMFAFTKVAL